MHSTPPSLLRVLVPRGGNCHLNATRWRNRSSKIKQVYASTRPTRRAGFFLCRSRQILNRLPLLQRHQPRPARLRILSDHLHVPRLSIARAIPEARRFIQTLPSRPPLARGTIIAPLPRTPLIRRHPRHLNPPPHLRPSPVQEAARKFLPLGHSALKIQASPASSKAPDLPANSPTSHP